LVFGIFRLISLWADKGIVYPQDARPRHNVGAAFFDYGPASVA
jgi:hypothetical protein